MRLLLNGGGSTKELKLTMSKLNEIMDHRKPILYVPLAMEETEHPYDSCYEWFQKQVENVDVPSIDMPRTFEEFAIKNFDNYSAIFIGGGNTYKLLKGIKDNGIFNKIVVYLNNNGIVIGCSAGAIIFGYDINSCFAMDTNTVNLEDTKGFNVLDGKSIFAHYTNEHTEEAHIKLKNYLTNYSLNKEEIIALPEEDTIFINDEDITIIGNRPYYEFRKGQETKMNDYNFRKMLSDEFDKLYNLFPDDDTLWLKYRDKRLNEIANKETDTYVIEHNGEFIGELTINYISHDLPTEAIPNQRVYLQAFRLDKKYQKQGLGQELISFVLNDLETKGYTEFTVGVEEDNIIAKHIYFKFGFTEAIDKGYGDEFDPTDYTLYMRSIQKENK